MLALSSDIETPQGDASLTKESPIGVPPPPASNPSSSTQRGARECRCLLQRLEWQWVRWVMTRRPSPRPCGVPSPHGGPPPRTARMSSGTWLCRRRHQAPARERERGRVVDAEQRARVSVGVSAAGGGMTVCVYVCVCDGGRRAHPVYGRADTLLAQSAREDVHIFAQRKGGRGGGVRATKTQFASIEFFFGFRPIATFVCISLGWVSATEPRTQSSPSHANPHPLVSCVLANHRTDLALPPRTALPAE